MVRKSSNLLLAFVFVLCAFLCVNAQVLDAGSASGRPDPRQMDLPESFKENLAKQKIKSQEKEFQELVKRAEEAAKIGEELSKSWETTRKFSPEDEKKLDRLEKLVKKIRTDLGAENEGEDAEKIEIEKPSNFQKAIKTIREDTANLISEIKKIGRHTISVIAIESSNTLLKLVRFLRFSSK